MIKVAPQHIVSLRYTMKDGLGRLLEDRMDAPPISYLQGGDRILPGLQQQLEGLVAGDRKQVTLEMPDDPTGRFFFEVIIDAVRQATAVEMELGYPLVLQVDKCEANCDCYKIS